MKLDSIDKKLINLLQTDAKQTHKNLARQLNLSVTATFERLKKLERSGVVNGYIASIDQKKIARDFTVFCHIKLIQHSKEYLTAFEREVIKLDEILECHHVSGDYDYILKIVVQDMEAYRDFMVTKLTTLKHIGSTHSIFRISEVKKSTVIKL